MCEDFENEKKKWQKIFDLPEHGFEPRIFSNFPAQDLNFHRKWSNLGKEVKISRLYQDFVSCNFYQVPKSGPLCKWKQCLWKAHNFGNRAVLFYSRNATSIKLWPHIWTSRESVITCLPDCMSFWWNNVRSAWYVEEWSKKVQFI